MGWPTGTSDMAQSLVERSPIALSKRGDARHGASTCMPDAHNLFFEEHSSILLIPYAQMFLLVRCQSAPAAMLCLRFLTCMPLTRGSVRSYSSIETRLVLQQVSGRAVRLGSPSARLACPRRSMCSLTLELGLTRSTSQRGCTSCPTKP